MTNIAQLPTQVEGAFTIATNADWRDCIQFQWAAGTANAGQPIDLTGITFSAKVKTSTAVGGKLLLDMSTQNGLLVVDAALGTLSFAVPWAQPTNGTPGCTATLPSETAAMMDILAFGDGQRMNLFQQGPASVTIALGVT